MTFKALRLFQNIVDEESAQKMKELIVSLAPTYDLGLELLTFTPEAFANQVVQYRDSDKLMPVINRGKPEHVLTKAQVRSYGYIEDAVFQYLHKAKPSEEVPSQPKGSLEAGGLGQASCSWALARPWSPPRPGL